MHGPRPPNGAGRRDAGEGQDSASGDGVMGDDDPLGSGGPSRRARYGERQTPRKSVDGGVRLAGGPLEMGVESTTIIERAAEPELDPPPMYKGPRRFPVEKGEL